MARNFRNDGPPVTGRPADRKNPAFLLFGRNKSVLLGRIFQLKLESAVELRRGNSACAEKGKTRDNFSLCLYSLGINNTHEHEDIRTQQRHFKEGCGGGVASLFSLFL